MKKKYEISDDWFQNVLIWIEEEISSPPPSCQDVQQSSVEDLQDVSPAGSQQVSPEKIQR